MKKYEKTLTKNWLYFNVIKNMLSVKFILQYVICMTVLGGLTALINIRGAVAGIGQIILTVLVVGVISGTFIAVFVAAMISFLTVPGINLISKQEKLLKFCFADEMRKLEVCDPFYVSPDWFIDARSGMVTAFRRDYVASLEGLKKALNQYSTGIPLAQITVVGADGKKRKIVNDFIRIFYFERWFLTCKCVGELCSCPELSDEEAGEWLDRYEILPSHSRKKQK